MLFLNILLSGLFTSAADPVHQILANQIDTMLRSEPPFITDRHLFTTLTVLRKETTDASVASSVADSSVALKTIEILALGGSSAAIDCLGEIVQCQAALVSDPYSAAFVKFHKQWGQGHKVEALKNLLGGSLSISNMQTILDLIVKVGKKDIEQDYNSDVKKMSEAKYLNLLKQKTQSRFETKRRWKEYCNLLILPIFSCVLFVTGLILFLCTPETRYKSSLKATEAFTGSYHQKLAGLHDRNYLNATGNFNGYCRLNGQQDFDGGSGSRIPSVMAVAATILGIVNQIQNFVNFFTFEQEQKGPDWALLEYHEAFKKNFVGPSILATVRLGTTIKLIAGDILSPVPGNILGGQVSGSGREPDFQFTESEFLEFTEERKEVDFKKYLLGKLQ